MATGRKLIGRDRELSLLRRLVDPPPADTQVLVLLGDAGMGKSVLLAEVERQARSAGLQVLSVAGRESERHLAFAGLHQLLRPVLGRVTELPDRQAKALLGAFALSDDPMLPDALVTGLAVLTLLSDLSEDRPLLATADDVQWLDRGSLDALSFAARRLDSERLALLLAARGNIPPIGFDRDFPELLLEPLSTADAGRLLDAQPRPPRGRSREQVLAQGAGNPMALIELARIIADDPAAGRRWAAEPLPPTDRLAAIVAAEFAKLPAATQNALLLAAVSDGRDLTVTAVPGLTAAVLAPAETAGLIKVSSSGPQFNHPLVRSAIYHAVPFAERAAAHLKIADTLRGRPDRYAWHLAAAALEPDERVAALLEQTAADAQRRGGSSVAGQALERAAGLSPVPEAQARRLVSAAEIAAPTGQTAWVEDLATQALALTRQPDLRLVARRLAGWALAWSGRHAAALSVLIPVAREASSYDPLMAWDALAFAASVAYQCGKPEAVQEVRETLMLLEHGARPLDRADSPAIEALQLWIRASTTPNGGNAEILARVKQVTQTPLSEQFLSRAGAAAWVLNQSDLAVELLRTARNLLDEPTVRAASGGSLSPLGWAYLDAGQWDDAIETAAEANELIIGHRNGVVSASADLITGTILAARGEGDEARARVSKALASDQEQSRLVTARAGHALGLAALAESNYGVAYGQLRQLFTDDGAPWHYHISYLVVADLAAAAVRADRRLEARELVEVIRASLPGTISPRLDQLFGRAQGLLADSSGPDTSFRKTLSDPAGELWPFERAQLRLDHGEWLRRHRRINDAKPVLAAALESFSKLRAQPWMRRAEAELRACGVANPSTAAAPGALWQLTPQQRQIIALAGHGYSNREIADRLFLSPRTVASHLYHSYPKLGISGRHQVQDLITRAGTEPDTESGG